MDEYEVARLCLKPRFQAEVQRLFLAPQRLVSHFHPPVLRALGLKRKLPFGPWFLPVLRLIRGLRRLRGTPGDIFGYSAVRREERQLIGWYQTLVETALQYLDRDTYAVVAEVAQLPDGIRGYEAIKLRHIRVARERAEKLLAHLAAPRAATPAEA